MGWDGEGGGADCGEGAEQSAQRVLAGSFWRARSCDWGQYAALMFLEEWVPCSWSRDRLPTCCAVCSDELGKITVAQGLGIIAETSVMRV